MPQINPMGQGFSSEANIVKSDQDVRHHLSNSKPHFIMYLSI
jgi:hypothetical protein